ncbi:MAG: phosphotransferase [Caldilineaceae bacterium]|nr:phosphotransferase [Caldilineaceae bacterium]
MTTTEIVHAALELYDLGNAQVELLRAYENLTYRVDADRHYALRICAATVDPGHLQAEVNWLTAIRAQTNLLTPKPILNREGTLISPVQDRLCVLFEWLDGQPVSKEMSPSVAHEIGVMMAKLHRQAAHYQPAGFAGTWYDYDCFFGPDSWWSTQAPARLADDYARMEPAIEKIKALLQRVGTSAQYFGMIHSDIHFGNVLRTPDGFAIIDFGDCGMGHYLLDVAVIEAEFQDYDDADALIERFREGYRIFTGAVPHGEDIRLFGILASLLYFEWVFESENEQVYQYKSEWLPGMIEEIKQL